MDKTPILNPQPLLLHISPSFFYQSPQFQTPLIKTSSSSSSTMASTLATMAMLNAKCLTSPNPIPKPFKPIPHKPISLLSIQNLPQGLTTAANPPPQTAAIVAGAIFSTLASCDAAFAAQQIADLAEGDNRGVALLLPLVPAIAWVLYNIFQPALNQINRMRTKGVVVGLGIGGGFAATSGVFSAPEAAAGEIAAVAEAAAGGSDNRGQLLLIVITPAILWVLYNILQPALNQINKMRS